MFRHAGRPSLRPGALQRLPPALARHLGPAAHRRARPHSAAGRLARPTLLRTARRTSGRGAGLSLSLSLSLVYAPVSARNQGRGGARLKKEPLREKKSSDGSNSYEKSLSRVTCVSQEAERVAVTCPPGVGAGARLTIRFPKPQQQPHPPSPGEITVLVPEHVAPGQSFLVAHGARSLLVVCPPHARAGKS